MPPGPFAGSGTTLVAAARHGRRWTGLELSKQYADRAAERVREATRSDFKVSARGT